MASIGLVSAARYGDLFQVQQLLQIINNNIQVLPDNILCDYSLEIRDAYTTAFQHRHPHVVSALYEIVRLLDSYEERERIAWL
jgi:hypothetical protein